MTQETVTVNLSDRSYPIFIGSGIIGETALLELSLIHISEPTRPY